MFTIDIFVENISQRDKTRINKNFRKLSQPQSAFSNLDYFRNADIYTTFMTGKTCESFNRCSGFVNLIVLLDFVDLKVFSVQKIL